jgi:hypothetical protein
MDYIKLTPKISDDWSRGNHYVTKEIPWAAERVRISMNSVQLESKLWLGSELKKISDSFNSVAVIGGWYMHFLGYILIDELNCKLVCNYEIDRDAVLISKKFNRRHNKNKKYKSYEANLFMADELREKKSGEVDLLINTSCEHMYHMKYILGKHFVNRPLCVLQSTDYEDYDDHINCVSSPDELADQAGLVDLYYSGTKVLGNGMNRFMVIGK